MKINHLNNLKTVSIELCSGKTLDINLLSNLNPLFYSITWHTNLTISTNDNFAKIPAFQTAANISPKTNSILLNLPCRYLSKETILKALTYAKDNGIDNIFALYGETQKSQENLLDFSHAIDLVSFIREQFGDYFSVGVAGFPSTHPRAPTPEVDLMYLKQKVDAGADFIITQAIFEVEVFWKFYENCRKIGITVPIIPCIHIIKSYDDLLAFGKLCKIVIPDFILTSLEPIKFDDQLVYNFGVSYTRDLIQKLYNNHVFPVKNVHICCLNNVEHVKTLCKHVNFI